MYSSISIAERIKHISKIKNILIKDMLEDCELSKNTLSSMQSGGSTPKSENLAKIADYLDCSVDYLLGRTDIPEVNRGTAEIINITPKEEFTGELVAFGGDFRNKPKKKKPQLT